jgi:hypothetical protein
MALSVGYRKSALAKAAVPGLLVLAAAGYAVHLALGQGPVTAVPVVACLVFAVVVFVPLFVRAVVRALLGAPLLTIDDDGVTLHSARVVLPWSNVAEVRVEQRPGGAPRLVFVPADPQRVVSAHRGLARTFARSGTARVGGPVFVRADQLALPLEDVLAAVRRSAPVPVRRREVLRDGPMGR